MRFKDEDEGERMDGGWMNREGKKWKNDEVRYDGEVGGL